MARWLNHAKLLLEEIEEKSPEKMRNIAMYLTGILDDEPQQKTPVSKRHIQVTIEGRKYRNLKAACTAYNLDSDYNYISRKVLEGQDPVALIKEYSTKKEYRLQGAQ